MTEHTHKPRAGERAAGKPGMERLNEDTGKDVKSYVSTTSRPGQIVLSFLQQAAWAFFFISLPVTSFPFFPPALGGGALVRPLTLYPLAALMLLVTLPRLFTRPLPRTLLSLLPFGLVALASSAISLLYGIEPALGVTVEARLLRALLTLALGVAIYLTVALTPRSFADLRYALRWLYAGFAMALAWGSLQAIYVVHYTQAWYRQMNYLQSFVSIRRLMHNRVSGMTYEPNWFAMQISFLLLPWLMASVLNNYSVFPWRWRRLTVEVLLLGWSILILPFTFSRAGVLAMVVLALVSVLFLRPGRSAQRVGERGRGREGDLGSPTPPRSLSPRLRLRRLAEAGLLALVALALLAGLVYVAGTRNEFFARIWDYWERKDTSLSGYLEYLGFGARFTYGETAFRTYQAYPLLGVGLGNYAFYFPEMLPERPLAFTPEVIRLVTPDVGRDRLITAKNFYFRILAETGLVGAAAFAAFLVAMLGCVLYLWLSPHPEEKTWGAAALLGYLAFFLAALSFDSFAIPNMWVVFGLITSASWLAARPGQETA